MVSKNVTTALKYHYPLDTLNTFGIHTYAENMLILTDLDCLTYQLESFKGQKVRVLGGGSNILLTKPVEGLLIWNQLKGKKILKESNTEVWLEVAAGEDWHKLVLWSLDNNYFGLENLSLIPGTVGASPIQNIGAYGVEVCQFIESVQAIDLQDGSHQKFSNQDCAFGYRQSIFKKELKGRMLITAVVFKLQKNPTIHTSYGAIQTELSLKGISNPTPKDVSEAVIKIRLEKLPNPEEIGNCGSFFKNPIVTRAVLSTIQKRYDTVPNYEIDENYVKIPAGWLIEMCGWKGKTIGNVGVHARQALVLINTGGAKGSEALQLAKQIQQSVFDTFSIHLEPEVNIW